MWGTLIGAIATALFNFFSTRAGAILLGLGMTLLGVKGFETLIGFVISDFQTLIGYMQGLGTSGTSRHWGAVMVQLAAYAGFFDALNIILSGYLAYAQLMALQRFFVRLAGK